MTQEELLQYCLTRWQESEGSPARSLYYHLVIMIQGTQPDNLGLIDAYVGEYKQALEDVIAQMPEGSRSRLVSYPPLVQAFALAVTQRDDFIVWVQKLRNQKLVLGSAQMMNWNQEAARWGEPQRSLPFIPWLESLIRRSDLVLVGMKGDTIYLRDVYWHQYEVPRPQWMGSYLGAMNRRYEGEDISVERMLELIRQEES